MSSNSRKARLMISLHTRLLELEREENDVREAIPHPFGIYEAGDTTEQQAQLSLRCQ